MKKQKILIISTVGLIYDGITSVIISYLKAMDTSDLDIYVAGTINVELRIREQIEQLGCKVVYFPNRREKTCAYEMSLIRFIKENNIDVVHAHGNSGTLAIEILAAWLSGCKKRIVHSHNTKCDQVKADKLLRPIMNLLYTDALACGIDAGKWLFGNKRFTVITNGRDTQHYKFNKLARERIRNEYGIDKELVIGHVGGFYEQKNHKYLIEIYRKTAMVYPNTHFFLIGEGPLKEVIKKETGDLNIHFTGAVDNVEDFLNAMDGMLLPSLFEGLPLVVIEWQINGLPAVISDNISDECILTGFIKKMPLSVNPQEWANKIIQMIKNNDREMNSELGSFVIKEKGYDIKDSAKMLKKLYEDKK